jgi:hypothetical protein
LIHNDLGLHLLERLLPILVFLVLPKPIIKGRYPVILLVILVFIVLVEGHIIVVLLVPSLPCLQLWQLGGGTPHDFISL